jgi:hypothetical protein
MSQSPFSCKGQWRKATGGPLAGGLWELGNFNIIDKMYTRQLMPQRGSPVEDGKPVQGTWTSAFEKVDLLSIYRPYPFPLPYFVLDLRLKEWHTFTTQNDEVWLDVVIADFKFFSFLEIVFFDKRGKEKMSVFKMLPFSAWKIPQSLNDNAFEYIGAGFAFNVYDHIDSQNITLDISVDAAIERPAFTVHIEFEINIHKATPLAVNLLLAENRCMYVFKAACGVNGQIVFGDKTIELDSETADGFFQDYKGFIPYRARYSNCRGSGIDAKGQHFSFSLGEHITKKLNVNNENALWVEGSLTPLPPVRITEAEPGEVFIQDLEGMVDLNFKVIENSETNVDFIFINMEHKNPAGYFNGMLMTRNGEKLFIRNVFGAVEFFDFRL